MYTPARGKVGRARSLGVATEKGFFFKLKKEFFLKVNTENEGDGSKLVISLFFSTGSWKRNFFKAEKGVLCKGE